MEWRPTGPWRHTPKGLMRPSILPFKFWGWGQQTCTSIHFGCSGQPCHKSIGADCPHTGFLKPWAKLSFCPVSFFFIEKLKTHLSPQCLSELGSGRQAECWVELASKPSRAQELQVQGEAELPHTPPVWGRMNTWHSVLMKTDAQLCPPFRIPLPFSLLFLSFLI